MPTHPRRRTTAGVDVLVGGILFAAVAARSEPLATLAIVGAAMLAAIVVAGVRRGRGGSGRQLLDLCVVALALVFTATPPSGTASPESHGHAGTISPLVAIVGLVALWAGGRLRLLRGGDPGDRRPALLTFTVAGMCLAVIAGGAL